ncbi:hypothetical protein Aple_097950 [Acrocarpospora pleiomorpha]|uniref:Uncharacterized protein n=1 Tax=Acrocarpospora pleiomorpha TaxID=90975 RepID=A0A5M3Y123_9ACTN|nr:hypothetical protein [Acrocarpospora pleiomorpha]GES26896.1 hypothetical protein Aple_097950 [Acrocarpospora pleiomorpha]
MAPGRSFGRHYAELAFPGLSIGVVAGAMAGGLTLLAGQSTGWAAVSALALALPLGLFGGVYGTLLGPRLLGGRFSSLFRPGVFAPAGVFWLIAFPLSRLFQETAAGLVLHGEVFLSGGLGGFLAYQAMVSLGFAIGFLWLHERFMPQWLMRLTDHNPEAALLLRRYVEHAETLSRARDRRRAKTKKGAR